jgi:hypothetical protein
MSFQLPRLLKILVILADPRTPVTINISNYDFYVTSVKKNCLTYVFIWFFFKNFFLILFKF